MPLYEYVCKDCRNKFELLTTYTASEVDVECVKCHGSNVRKLISVVAKPRASVSDSYLDAFGGDFGSEGDYGDEGEGGDGCCGGSCGCHD